MIRPLTIFTVGAFATAMLTLPALADINKLGNDKLKAEGFTRLEGKNAFKPGCRHVIRSADRQTVMHPTVLTNEALGLHYDGRYVSVKSGDKTRLAGAGLEVTVWRNCSGI